MAIELVSTKLRKSCGFDPETEHTKLSDEIRRWQLRSISGSLSFPVSEEQTKSANVEHLLENEWRRLKMDELLERHDLDKDSEITSIVMIDEIVKPYQSENGFFLTSSTEDENHEKNAKSVRPRQQHFERTQSRVKKQESFTSLIKISEDSVNHRRSTRYSSFKDDGDFVTEDQTSELKSHQISKLFKDLKEQVEFARFSNPHTQPMESIATPASLFAPRISNNPHNGLIIEEESNEIKIRTPEMRPTKRVNCQKEAAELTVELHRQIGFGGASRVYLGVIKGTGEIVAVKKVSLKSGKISRKVVKLEIDILRKLNHLNLVQYRGYKMTKKECYIVLEYVAGGSLDQHLSETGALDEERAAYIISQVLYGLEYLHTKRILHRDIKPGNILIGEDGRTVKLTDFGVSAQLISFEGTRTSCTGTPWFVAPEVVQVRPYSYKADVWSVGSTCFEMVTGSRPWGDLNQVAAMYKTVTEGHPPLDELDISLECKDFLHACWTRDWKERPDVQMLLKHPWINLGKCLE